jgi:RNA recognition motif-containing protein|tara:strand:- start:59 stop:310 length:252 start_codon:yes stop_codon:yes gene_type:complete
MNIYCGNLSYQSADEDLNTLFQEYGDVASAKVIRDRETDRSRGFGFVEMESDDEAQNAIDALNGQEFMGRKLVVNESRPRTPR